VEERENSDRVLCGQCRNALKPDGLFLAAMLGGETLK
jgi:hypothetical protein